MRMSFLVSQMLKNLINREDSASKNGVPAFPHPLLPHSAGERHTATRAFPWTSTCSACLGACCHRQRLARRSPAAAHDHLLGQVSSMSPPLPLTRISRILVSGDGLCPLQRFVRPCGGPGPLLGDLHRVESSSGFARARAARAHRQTLRRSQIRRSRNGPRSSRAVTSRRNRQPRGST
jgi:hypothetical protein